MMQQNLPIFNSVIKKEVICYAKISQAWTISIKKCQHLNKLYLNHTKEDFKDSKNSAKKVEIKRENNRV